MPPAILTINAGSSSVKFAVFALRGATDDPALVLRGGIEAIGVAPRFAAEDAKSAALPGLGTEAGIKTHDDAIAAILDWLEDRLAGREIGAAGHRVVHGGIKRVAPAPVDAALIEELAALSPLAPHHQPHNVAAIRAIAKRRPNLKQIACFDTAFHATQPAIARRYALPRELEEAGIRRYGFHGLSYEYLISAMPRVIGHLPERVIALHLGNGASMCAIRAGKSIATTMGFSTVEGLMMGTRAGSIDPGVLIYLMRERGMGHAELTDLVYNRSGLKGVSGISSDMRTLLASSDPRASEAVELYCYRIVREIGSLVAALHGVDALVFAGGVGERAVPVRARILAQLGWLGVVPDEAANAGGGPRLTAETSRVVAWIVPTNEELVIARYARSVLHSVEVWE
ncbi:MAG: acetate/propionate family kinase [Alphaproteobacteria bacterium]|nr:acetate/propionate family kinase [Alphaproteobacteria bacterium]